MTIMSPSKPLSPPQYYSLNALSERYADKPFKILGFPCNQFLRQVIAKSMTRNMSGVL